MTDDDKTPIPQAALDAAGDWFARRQRIRSTAMDAGFERWLFEDPAHRAAYRRVSEQWEASGLAAQGAFGRTRELGRAPFYQREAPRKLVAAIVVMLLLVAGAFAAYQAGLRFTLSSPAEAAVYQTRVGEIRTIRLQDGSSIILDTATKVEARYSATERRLILSGGRARFTVAVDPSRPFVVAVPDGEIVARQTVFDVEARSHPSRAAILRGSVEMRSGAASSRRGWLLEQGSEAPLTSEPSAEPIKPGEARWVDGMIALNQTPVAAAVAQINRYNERQIRLADASLDTVTISGAFNARDPVAFAEMITQIAPVRIKQSSATIIEISGR